MTSFGDAFKAARKSGKTTFKFGGKSYHTKTKDEMAKSKKAVPTPTARPSRDDSSTYAGQERKPTPGPQQGPQPAKPVGIASAKSPIGQAAARAANAPSKPPIQSPAASAASMGNAGAPLTAAQKASIAQATAKPSTPAAAAPEKQGPQPEDQQFFAKKGSAISLAIARRKNAPSR